MNVVSYIITSYCKRQKISERIVLQLTGFHPNVRRENLHGFCLTYTINSSIAQVFIGKTFMIHQKSVKTVKVLSHVAFVVYSIIDVDN